MTIFLTIAFFSILSFFGWETARWVLHENRIERLIALGGIFGIGLYIFFINIAGFFIPIQTVFYLVLLLFLLFASILFFCRWFQMFGDHRTLEWGLDTRWRNILLFSALFLTLSVGLISFRHPMDLFTLREPTAATIAEGNFPPKEIWSPDSPLQYHYAPDLFSAAIYKVTGMPLYLAYDFQKALLSGILFLLGFILVNSFFPSVFVAFWASVFMFYSGSLVFLKGLGGIPILFGKYILGKEVVAPFKFVTDAIGADSGLPVINYVLQIHWGAMAFALMLALVYMYFHLLNRAESKSRWPAFVLAGFLLALLALVAESYFVVLVAVLFVFPFIMSIFKKYRGTLKEYFLASFFIVLLAVPVAIFQGGVLKSAIYQQLHLSSGGVSSEAMLYTDNKPDEAPLQLGTPFVLYDGTPVYDIGLLAKWILLLVVLVPAFVFLFKQSFGLAIFLASAAVLFFEAPFLFYSNFQYINENIARFFYPVNMLGGLVVGIFLATLYLRVHKPLLKWALVFFTVILLAQGLWTHTVWLSFGYPPGDGWNPNAVFFAKAGTVEADAYQWVKKNTTVNDQFFILRDGYSICGISSDQNCPFILNTGRMAPTFMLEGIGDATGSDASSGNAALFGEASKSCDSSILKKLHFNYLYVDEQWPDGMEAKCLQNNKLQRVFKNGSGSKFVRIYSII